MKNSQKFAAIFTLLIFIGSVPVLADSASEAPKAKPTEVPSTHLTRREILEKIQATQEQRRLLQKNRAAYRKKVTLIDNQIKLKKVELESELEKPEPDMAKIDQITAEIGTLLGQKYNVQIKAELEVEKKILTPQQVEQLKALEGKEIYLLP